MARGRLRIDLIGQKFQRLLVTSFSHIHEKHGYAMWTCVCECGKQRVAAGRFLRNGDIRSCGCDDRQVARSGLQKNSIRLVLGLSARTNLKAHRTYRIWYGMRQRCQYKQHHAWHRYGGRGITVDPTWEDFLTFLADMGHPPTEQHTIDRINNDGNYEKSNCQWITKSEQNKNKSNNWKIEAQQGTQTLTEFCKERNLNYVTVHKRLTAHGWSFEDAINTPIRSKNHA